MNTLEQTTQLAIELIKQQQATDYEFSVGKSSGVSTSVRLSEVETLNITLMRVLILLFILVKTRVKRLALI